MLGYLDVLFNNHWLAVRIRKFVRVPQRSCMCVLMLLTQCTGPTLLLHLLRARGSIGHCSTRTVAACTWKVLPSHAIHAVWTSAATGVMCAKALANIKPQIVVSMRQSPNYAHARYCLPSHSELYNTNLSTTIHNSVAIWLAGPPTMDPIARVRTQWSDTHTFSLVNVLIEILYAEWHCAMQW